VRGEGNRKGLEVLALFFCLVKVKQAIFVCKIIAWKFGSNAIYVLLRSNNLIIKLIENLKI
jgi:hypothetical protein